MFVISAKSGKLTILFIIAYSVRLTGHSVSPVLYEQNRLDSNYSASGVGYSGVHVRNKLRWTNTVM